MFMCEMITFFRHLPLTVRSSLKRLPTFDTSLVSRNRSSLVVSPSELVLKNESVNCGSTHVVQNQGSEWSLPSSLYSLTDMLMHLQCSQRSHESHCIPAWLPLTGLPQVPQGNLQLLGPGFSETSPLNRSINTP